MGPRNHSSSHAWLLTGPGVYGPWAGNFCCLHDYNDDVKSREFYFTGPHPTSWLPHTSHALFCSVRLAFGKYKSHNTPPKPKENGWTFNWQLWVSAFSITGSTQTPAELTGPSSHSQLLLQRNSRATPLCVLFILNYAIGFISLHNMTFLILWLEEILVSEAKTTSGFPRATN